MFKKTILLTGMLFTMLAISNYNYNHTYSNSFQPPPGNSGNPADGGFTCARSGCHGGVVNTGTGSVTLAFSGGVTYVPGETYSIGVIVVDPSRSRFGFSMSAIDASGNVVGSFVAGDNSAILADASIGHQSASDAQSFEFEWQAPSSDVGPVDFFVAGLAADNNFSNAPVGGDLTYTTQLSIVPDVENSTEDLSNESAAFAVYPNPVRNILHSTFTLTQSDNVTIDLFDIKGQHIETLTKQALGAGTHHLSVVLANKGYAQGLYFVQLQSSTGTKSQKIIIE